MVSRDSIMGSMNFLSLGELQTSVCNINEMLTDNGRIIVTNNGKPAAFMIAIDESSLEETLNDWHQIRGMRSLRKLQEHAERSGLTEMTSDEINAEIAEVRRERQERNTQWETR